MGIITLPGEPEVEVQLRRSARARRLSLRVSGVDGRVTLTMPRFAAEREARSFAAEKAGWIRDRLAEQAPLVPVALGAVLPVEGISRRIEAAPVRCITLADQAFLVPEGAGRLPARLGAHLRAMARERLAEATARHAAALGRPHGRITLRDTRSRWGSCTHEGNLMFSWRLIMAPPAVLDYVVAHEVAHLAHMDHSPRFWAACARLCPGYEAPRRWLRQHGAALHRYGFKA